MPGFWKVLLGTPRCRGGSEAGRAGKRSLPAPQQQQREVGMAGFVYFPLYSHSVCGDGVPPGR